MTEPTLSDLRSKHMREERALVLAALRKSAWSLAAAARQLEVPPSTLQSLIHRLGLDEDYAERAKGTRGRPKKNTS